MHSKGYVIQIKNKSMYGWWVVGGGWEGRLWTHEHYKSMY